MGDCMTYKADVLANVYTLMGLDADRVDENKGKIIEFTYDIVADEILNYCHLDELPKELANVMASMIVDLYRMGDFGTDVLTKEPTSITRGDVSISYRLGYERSNDSQRNSMYILSNSVLMKDYYKQLNAFRRVVW